MNTEADPELETLEINRLEEVPDIDCPVLMTELEALKELDW